MIPSKGRIVLVTGVESNGSMTHPAIVTAVWGEPGEDTRNAPVNINCTVFTDMATPKHHGTIPLYDTEEEGEASTNRVFAYWPPRV